MLVVRKLPSREIGMNKDVGPLGVSFVLDGLNLPLHRMKFCLHIRHTLCLPAAALLYRKQKRLGWSLMMELSGL